MKFSLIMPSLDRASLTEAVDSVLAQSHQDWELLIMGQGNPPTIAKDPRITYMVHESVTLKINLLLEMANGDVINFAADDDTLTPDALKIVAENFKTDWLVGRIQISDGKIGGAGPCTLEELLQYNRIPCPAVYWSKNVANKVGYWKRTMSGDYDYWIRIWKMFGPPTFIPDILSNYNVHPDQDSQKYGLQVALEAAHISKLHSMQ